VRGILATSLLALATVLPAHAAEGTLAQANAALQAGQADKAMSILSSLPESAEVHQLKCRVQFTLEHWDAAGAECQRAVNLDSNVSDSHLWLGRALGERAGRASFLSAYSLGKSAGAEFQRAVDLDPRNAEALADLGEFDSSAPGIVGGGTDKAEHVVALLDKVDPARAHELRGRIADGQKDYGTAEREFKAAISVSKRPAFEWMNLASFYRRRQRWEDMESAVENGLKAAQYDRHSGVALYNGALVLIKANRNSVLAAKMLEDYLAGPYLTEEAPAFAAHTQLARLRAQLGDKQGAWRERSAALGLAHDYRPAQQLKF